MSEQPTWDIRQATAVVIEAAALAAATEPDLALIEARLADHYRDVDMAPLDPSQVRVVTGEMGAADWQRLCVIVTLLGCPPLRAVLPVVRTHGRESPVRLQLAALVGVAKALASLEMRTLAASDVRAEELARRVARALGVGITGETLAESAQRLARIDYTRLLANVDTARAAAAADMADLRRQQDQRDMRHRRGKW